MSERHNVLFPLPLRAWVQERLNNCERIAAQKTGGIREGWIEDASYFRAILAVLDNTSGVSEPAKSIGWGRGMFIAGAAAGVTPDKKPGQT